MDTEVTSVEGLNVSVGTAQHDLLLGRGDDPVLSPDQRPQV